MKSLVQIKWWPFNKQHTPSLTWWHSRWAFCLKLNSQHFVCAGGWGSVRRIYNVVLIRWEQPGAHILISLLAACSCLTAKLGCTSFTIFAQDRPVNTIPLSIISLFSEGPEVSLHAVDLISSAISICAALAWSQSI